MKKQWISQIGAVIRLELKKSFFTRRALWVYFLAFAPVLLFTAHSIFAPRTQERLAHLSAGHSASTASLLSIKAGDTLAEVQEKGGTPYYKWSGRIRTEGVRGDMLLKYTDGRSDFYILFENGRVKSVNHNEPDSLAQSSLIFATSFQVYFLRVAIFFGCVGIFTNLFRGEMMEKSLHFYLLTPLRREVLLAGKYLAGLFVTLVIFGLSAAIQLSVMLAEFDHETLARYLAGPGWGEIFWYVVTTMLACIGYGSIFVAAGLFFRNPIIPTVIVLLWEGANIFLPSILKKISLIFYLQSLCPVVAPSDVKLPAAYKLLISTTEPVAPAMAICGILAFTALVLIAAGRRARTLEINYSVD